MTERLCPVCGQIETVNIICMRCTVDLFVMLEQERRRREQEITDRYEAYVTQKQADRRARKEAVDETANLATDVG